MDDIKREELEKACKKIYKVRARMVAIRMVRVFNMPVWDTASLPKICDTAKTFDLYTLRSSGMESRVNFMRN